MGQIIAVSNQKGGVGKTTSSVNLAAELVLMGRRVLLIDFDPQGNTTSGMGIDKDQEGEDLYDVFFGKVALSGILKDSPFPELSGLKIAASTKDLIGVEVELGKPKRGGGGKAHVYVRDPKTGNVKKVSFGSSMPDAMGDSDAARKRRKSFGDRHNCSDKKDRTKPGYWACRSTKFFGRNIPGWW